uniref:Putative glycosyltransferase n=1 Tax=viral metagenome TaxID=1070528 RepID=A0A6M3Y513_9ZZZZ
MKNTKPKIALLSVCLNQPYWPYAKKLYEDVDKHLLKGHQIDKFLWTDMPPMEGINVIPTPPITWPLPTLMRYNLYLQEEERLKEYDYIYHIDVDMEFREDVGEEILTKKGLMAAIHPMFTKKKGFEYAPFELNKESTAYVDDPDPKAYYAGGFQGGKAKPFIKAMKKMKENIDKDFNNNYIARWNDESHWNKYLQENPPEIVLSPSYVYPDSLIPDYYEKIWPENHGYIPKIITITKPFTISKEGGTAVREHLERLSRL